MKNSSRLPWTKGLDLVPSVRLRRVPLPTESIIQRNVVLKLPGILGEKIELRSAHVHPVCRSLGIRVWQTKKIVGYETAEPYVVRTAAIEGKTATDVVEVHLMHALVADVSSKLQCVLAHNTAVSIQYLINVSCLRKISRLVVTKSKAPSKRNKGNTFVAGAKPGCNPKVRVCRIGKTLVCRNHNTGGLDQIGAGRGHQLALPVPVINKTDLVACLRGDGPDMRQVHLLKTALGFI